MSSSLQAIKPTGSTDWDGEQLSIALIGGGAAALEISATLAEQEFDVALVDRVDDLAAASLDPSVIALWAEGDPGKAVGADLGREPQLLERAPVVVVCAELRPRDLRAVLSAGVSGVVLETALETALAPSLRAASAGQICVPRQSSEQIEPASLTPREKQILGLVVMGYMNVQIAEQLFVTEATVKSHLSSAFNKLGVRSRTEAAELILDSERGLGVGILALGGEPLEVRAGM